jgi:hypothetical protein
MPQILRTYLLQPTTTTTRHRFLLYGYHWKCSASNTLFLCSFCVSEKKREDEHSKQRRDEVMEVVGCDDNLNLCEDSLSDGRDEVMLQYGLLLQ